MTNRTIDINCRACRKYIFPLQPDDVNRLKKDYYCKNKSCQEQATHDRLKEPYTGS